MGGGGGAGYERVSHILSNPARCALKEYQFPKERSSVYNVPRKQHIIMSGMNIALFCSFSLNLIGPTKY